MDIGPIIIRKCQNCGGLIEQETILSGNTFGARYWTDGKMEAPMLPDLPQFVKCPHCGTNLWIEEQEKIAEVLPYSVQEEFPESRPYKIPDLEDYFQVIKNPKLTCAKKQYIRIQIWWTGNDLRRENGNRKVPEMSRQEIDNLQHLFLLLDHSNEQHRLMKAEIYRELGQFEEALELLDLPFGKDLQSTASFIKMLAQQAQRTVVEIKNNQ